MLYYKEERLMNQKNKINTCQNSDFFQKKSFSKDLKKKIQEEEIQTGFNKKSIG